MSGLPVVFGWGKKGKFIGYVGIDKCPNCKNYVHFSIYEYSNRVNIYFVPIIVIAISATAIPINLIHPSTFATFVKKLPPLFIFCSGS